MRDLYRGDGGRLSSYDEGWNDGVVSVEKAIRPIAEQARALAIAEAARKIAAFKVSVGNSAAGEIAAEMTMDALRELHDEILTLAGQSEYPSTADDEATRWRHGEEI